VSGGEVWRRALGDTCDVLGRSMCDEAVQVARDQLRGWAARAPELVSRAVVASVTREACSTAGRGVVARTAAEVLTAGGSEAEAEDAAREALEPLIRELADDAVAAIDGLAGVSQ
jgi:hypothetical protein